MEKKRTTPEYITSLQPNEIFAFGSNLHGMHGGGAAYVALRKFGAIMGQGVGLQGQSYAIPTMQGGVETIRPYVDEFIEFANYGTQFHILDTLIEKSKQILTANSPHTTWHHGFDGSLRRLTRQNTRIVARKLAFE